MTGPATRCPTVDDHAAAEAMTTRPPVPPSSQVRGGGGQDSRRDPEATALSWAPGADSGPSDPDPSGCGRASAALTESTAPRVPARSAGSRWRTVAPSIASWRSCGRSAYRPIRARVDSGERSLDVVEGDVHAPIARQHDGLRAEPLTDHLTTIHARSVAERSRAEASAALCGRLRHIWTRLQARP